MAKEETKNSQNKELDKLDAIKEIIFGQNIREYEKEFNEIRQYINDNLNAIDKEFDGVKKLLAETEKKILHKMETNHQEVLKKIADLDEKKVDRKKLGKYLSDIGEKLAG